MIEIHQTCLPPSQQLLAYTMEKHYCLILCIVIIMIRMKTIRNHYDTKTILYHGSTFLFLCCPALWFIALYLINTYLFQHICIWWSSHKAKTVLSYEPLTPFTISQERWSFRNMKQDFRKETVYAYPEKISTHTYKTELCKMC